MTTDATAIAAPVRGAAAGTLQLDRAQFVSACDSAFCRLFECEPADVIGSTLSAIVSPGDRRGEHELATRINRGRVADLLLTLRVGANERFARVRLNPIDEGFHCSVEAVGGDDDLLYRLVGVEQRWKGVFFVSDEGLAVLDAEGRIVEHNPAFVALMGFSDKSGVSLGDNALVGRPFIEVVASAQTEVPGLVDYLASPHGDFAARTSAGMNSRELKARSLQLPSHDKLGILVLVRDIGEELQIAARDAIIQSDLSRARAFQRLILSEPPQIPMYDLALTYRPLDLVGGDLYDIEMLPAGRVRIFIADATGHGVAAALVTMLVKSAYDFVKHTLGGPAAVLEALNDRIAGSYKSVETMFTGLVMDLAMDSHEIEYANAGHPPPIVVDRDGVRELECGGTVLGVAAYNTYPSRTMKLHEESAIYLVTDGLAEARRANGEYLGEARLNQLIAEADQLPGDPGKGILAKLDEWLYPQGPNDDITIIALRPTARRQATPRSEAGLKR